MIKCLPIGHYPSSRSGFTLIELVVTLGIFTVMTAMVLANYPAFNTRIARDVLVQNIALSIREAQVSGTSIRSTVGVTGANTGVAGSFGMHFHDNDPKNYYLFTDRQVGDGILYPADTLGCPLSVSQYNDDDPPECIERYSIASGPSKILFSCGNYIGNRRADCDAAASDTTNNQNVQTQAYKLTNLNILFKRPNPEAYIIGSIADSNNGFNCGAMTDTGDPVDYLDPDNQSTSYCKYSNVAIFIGDGAGTYRKVIIWNTGQIAVE